MTAYWVTGIPEKSASQVRETLQSAQYPHPATVDVARGYGPCRSCLQTFRSGQEERILFTYNPFEGLDAYPLPGPIFVHRVDCQQYSGSAFPAGLRTLPLTFEGYGRSRWPVSREACTNEDVEGAIARLFAHPAVDYIHVRNTEAGCFIALILRAPVTGL